MNEIDLYINLIDEEETNKILKYFNQTVKSENLEFKKTKIKTIFRGQQTVKKMKTNGPSPFLAALQRHQIEIFKTYDEKEFLMALNEGIGDVADYVKFANLVIKLPNKINEYLDMIKSNINSNKYLFDFGVTFNDDLEIIRYFNKASYFSNEKTLLRFIDKFHNKAVKDNLIPPLENTQLEIIKKYSFQELYKRIQGEHMDNVFNIKYMYIKTHPKIDKELMNGFCGDIIIELMDTFSMIKSKDSDKKLNVDTTEIKTLENKLEKLTEEKKILDKEYINYVKKSQKEIKSRIEELEEYKNKMKTLNSEVVDINALSERIKEMEIKNKDLESKYKDEKKKNKEYEKQRRETNVYYEYAFTSNELNEANKIGIIHSMEYINLAKIIFNDVNFITLNNWKEQINKLEVVYIQREGISTRKLEEIRDYCSQRGITNKVISIDNEKTLIENISLIKANGRRI